jgi:fido (protein-threonine AMPylation protein)
VTPELVPGTLRKAFEFIAAAPTPYAKAALAMFVVAEVHPFTDGNGRTARLAMNMVLSEAHLTRIIIPTAFREDYMTALKTLSGADHHVQPYVNMLIRAGKFSRWLEYQALNDCCAQLQQRSNALGDTGDVVLRFGDEFRPPC